MRKSIQITILVLIVLLVGCSTRMRSQEIDSAEQIRRVENGLLYNQNIEERMEAHQVPGLSIALIEDFKLDWAKGYGVLELGKDEPVTADTIYQVGSVAKPVTTITALHYVEQGLLDLDEDVNQKLVSWQIPENEYTAQADVTLRRLLSHTGGINQGLNRGYAPGEGVPILLQSLDGVPPANTLPVRVDRVPGTECYYSNGGYLVVVQLLEDVLGLPFTTITTEAVFQPLGMTSSTFAQTLPEDLEARAATPHGWDVNTWDEAPGLIAETHIHDPGYGGLWSTATDLALLGIEIMRTKTGEAQGVINQDTFNLIQTPISKGVAMQAPFKVDMGLGIDLLHLGGETWLIHFGGSFPGFVSVLLLEPESGFGVVILTNSFTAYELIWEILYSIFFNYGFLPTNGQILGTGYSLLLLLALFTFRPKRKLIQETDEPTQDSELGEKRRCKAGRWARTLLILTGFAIFVLTVRYWGPFGGYQLHPLWKGETVLNKGLLGTFFSTPIFLVILTWLVWRQRCWSHRERLHYTLLVLGTLVGVFLLRELWPLMFWG